MSCSRTAEAKRLAELESYEILDTEAEENYDAIVNLAAEICEAPVSLITFVAADRQWFKARCGFDAFEVPLDQSICVHTFGQPDVVVIPDLTQDERTLHNALVTREPGLRFYAGAALVTPAGECLGALCVLDRQPRPQGLTALQVTTLRSLARQVMMQLELRRTARAEAKARKALDTNRTRYQAIFESAIDHAIIVTDRDGVIIDWNEGAFRTFGWTAQEIHGQQLSILFMPEDRTAGIPEQEMQTALALGLGSDERWHLRKDGQRFWATGDLKPLRSGAGELEGFVKILRDRTSRRLAEEQLAVSEKRWRELFENMREGFFVGEVLRDDNGKACDYRFVEVNPAFTKQSGLPASAVGRTVRSFANDVQQSLIDRVTACVDTEEPQAFEVYIPELRRWFEARAAKKTSERFSCLFVDITARKEIEVQLTIKDERLQMALTASGIVGLWDWMIDTDLLHGDATFARLYGLDVQQTAAGLTMEAYQTHVAPEDLPPLREKIRAVFEEGADFLSDYRLLIPGQPLRWVECKGRLISGPDGRPARFSGTAIDITDRKAAEQQKQLLMEELSHRVKNTFAVVQAMAMQTLRGIDDEVVTTFQNRLASLSRAHDVLLRKSWVSATLMELMDNVLRLEAEGGRYRISGPNLTIRSRAALSLSLLLHEMATNAVKYGALSVDGGKVEVEWAVEGDMFRLDWREIGGPPAEPPRQRGFGTRLIQMGINGARLSEVRYGEDGLRAVFRAPMSSLLDT